MAHTGFRKPATIQNIEHSGTSVRLWRVFEENEKSVCTTYVFQDLDSARCKYDELLKQYKVNIFDPVKNRIK